MNNNGRIVFSLLTIGILLSQPLMVIAQTRQPFNPTATIQGSGSTFGGVSFSGVGGALASCSNVGGSVTNLVSKGTSSIAGLFKPKPRTSAGIQTSASQTTQNINSSASSPAASISVSKNIKNALGVSVNQSVPVSDKPGEDELKKANQRESCLNGVAYAVAKSLLQQVTNKTLNWVNRGFNGNPLYVRDIDSYLKSISDDRIALFLDRIPNQNPIFGNAIRSIITEQVSGISDGLINKVMDTPQGRAYQAFQEDFTNGGWEAFLDPSNSPIDAVFNAADELDRDISNKQQEVQDQLQRNGGFLDLQKCVEYESPQSSTSSAQSAAETIRASNAAGAASGIIGSGRDLSVDALGNSASSGRISTPQELLKPDQTLNRCIRYETVTPGSVISAQVNEVTTSPIRQLEQADQINEVLGSFFDQLLNNLIAGGLASLQGSSTNDLPNFGGLGSNVVTGANGQIVGTTNALGYQTSSSGYNGDFDISRPQELRAVLQTQYDYLNRSLDAHIALNRIIPTLGALDYCIPGPNPSWQDGLQENGSVFFGSLVAEGSSNKGANTGSTIGQLAGTVGGTAAGAAIGGTAVGAAVGSVLPGIGTVIGSVLGGLVGSLFGDKPHDIYASNISLHDKISNQDLPISGATFSSGNHSPGYVFDQLHARYNEMVALYKTTFPPEAIKNAFISVDPANQTYASGFVDDALAETGKLPLYNQALIELEQGGGYDAQEKSAREAIAELEAIRTEVNDIVSTAKARYIAEQAAAGTPVKQSCLDSAYSINTSPIVPVPRQESDTPSPLTLPSVEASTYFYSHL